MSKCAKCGRPVFNDGVYKANLCDECKVLTGRSPEHEGNLECLLALVRFGFNCHADGASLETATERAKEIIAESPIAQIL